MDNHTIADELEGLITAATKGDLATAELHTASEMVECPLCGDGEIEAANYCNFDDIALGVQFYGIGNEFGAHEKLWRWFTEHRETILAALRAPAPAPVAVGGDVVERVGMAIKNIPMWDGDTLGMNLTRDELGAIARTALAAMPVQAPVADDVRSIVQTLCDVITQHHQWHAAQTTPDPEHGYVPADEYAESGLYERTVDALHKASHLLEPNPNLAAIRAGGQP